MKTGRSIFIVLACLLPVQGETTLTRKFGILGGAQSVTLPYKSTFAGIFVEVSINEKPVELMLDTGSDNTMLSPGAARRIGLKNIEGTLRVESATGEEVIPPLALTKRIALGDAWTENEAVLIYEFTPGIAGILGVGTLAGWDVRIDPSAQRVTLFAVGNAPPLEGETTLPLLSVSSPQEGNALFPHGLRTFGLTVPVRIDGIEIQAIPDTGYGGILQLTDALMEKVAPGTLKNAAPTLITGISLTGHMATRSTRVRSVQFGPDTLSDFPVDAIEFPSGSRMQYQALLGLNLLRHYVMTFRFSAGQLRLKPLGTVEEIIRASTAGIHLGFDEKVLSVDPGGPADKVGLRAGDRVLEIGGRPLQSLKPEDMAAFKRLPPGSVVKLRYRRGDAEAVEIKLVLEKK